MCQCHYSLPSVKSPVENEAPRFPNICFEESLINNCASRNSKKHYKGYRQPKFSYTFISIADFQQLQPFPIPIHQQLCKVFFFSDIFFFALKELIQVIIIQPKHPSIIEVSYCLPYFLRVFFHLINLYRNKQVTSKQLENDKVNSLQQWELLSSVFVSFWGNIT